ncbi:hypothetical protein ACFFUP_12305 [Vibrio ostreicida]|uniref:Uncharacterized protein n=2 Tax=Vibrio ostreicida TaxID=526588 RepID=A0ABT8BYZ2_9VIBR|nr:hypothetical protein [Vibrio ostreicida]MDN3611288.1 hypothetical protein [Vibrio ostreicida]NPD09232.1 hypothetical protein [Vibrio ostreicida]
MDDKWVSDKKSKKRVMSLIVFFIICALIMISEKQSPYSNRSVLYGKMPEKTPTDAREEYQDKEQHTDQNWFQFHTSEEAGG